MFGGSLQPGTVAFIFCMILVVVGFAVVGILYAKNHGKQEELDAHRRSQNAAERARAAAADAETIARQDEDDQILMKEHSDYLIGAGGSRNEFETTPKKPTRSRAGTTTARNAEDLDEILDEELTASPSPQEAASVSDFRSNNVDEGSLSVDDIDTDLL